MHALGFIPRLPRLLGVQAEGARALVDAFARGDATRHRRRADGRRQHLRRPPAQRPQGARGRPRVEGRVRRRAATTRSWRRSRATGRLAGVFGEPAGCRGHRRAAPAVADGIVGRSDARVVAVVTGNGLKDAKTALRAVGKPFDLPPDDAALDDLLAEHPPA